TRWADREFARRAELDEARRRSGRGLRQRRLDGFAFSREREAGVEFGGRAALEAHRNEGAWQRRMGARGRGWHWLLLGREWFAGGSGSAVLDKGDAALRAVLQCRGAARRVAHAHPFPCVEAYA